jgi:hypothetical protein
VAIISFKILIRKYFKTRAKERRIDEKTMKKNKLNIKHKILFFYLKNNNNESLLPINYVYIKKFKIVLFKKILKINYFLIFFFFFFQKINF